MSVRVSGIGVHSGKPVTVTLHRVAGPLAFRRGHTVIPASYAYVSETRRATSLTNEGESVHMVEHLLAALAIRGYYEGVLAEVSANELPVLDGSAAEWDAVLSEFPAPSPLPRPITISKSHRVELGESYIELQPGEEQWCVNIDFPHPHIGVQQWCGARADYPSLLPARTFGFRHELDQLRAAGLAGGASLANVLVFTETGTLNEPRHPHEPVQHKALDLIGDLALLGRPVHGLGTVVRGSHALHHQLVRDIAKTYLTPGANVR